MRRIFAFLAVGALTALAIGSAASLGVNGGTIQEGSDVTLTCDDAVQVISWGLEASDGDVYFVRIGDISADCFGNELFVNVTDGTGSIIAFGSVEEPPGIDAAEESVSLNTPVDALDIEDIHIFIEGPAASAEVVGP